MGGWALEGCVEGVGQVCDECVESVRLLESYRASGLEQMYGYVRISDDFMAGVLVLGAVMKV